MEVSFSFGLRSRRRPMFRRVDFIQGINNLYHGIGLRVYCPVATKASHHHVNCKVKRPVPFQPIDKLLHEHSRVSLFHMWRELPQMMIGAIKNVVHVGTFAEMDFISWPPQFPKSQTLGPYLEAIWLYLRPHRNRRTSAP